MQTYLVGGAVRDRLLGLSGSDRDWVVVGATPQEMMAQGFVPVGRDFPVFLHPRSHEEYALARTERKSGRGYRGFTVHTAPGITLEEDLARRDLTLNAIAVEARNVSPSGDFDPASASLIDPFGGQRDLKDKVLRHVTDAFREDPVRILRVARFAARFAGFSVAKKTQILMREMVSSGEVNALVPERVWQELARGLMQPRPSRMFEVLRDCGALAVLLPELDRLWGVPQSPRHHPEIDTGAHLMRVIDTAAACAAPLSVRFACLMHDLGKGITPPDLLPRHPDHELRGVSLVHTLCERWRVPIDLRQLAELTTREHGRIHACADQDADGVLALLERCDALRKSARFALLLQACEYDARGRLGFESQPYAQRDRLSRALAAALAVRTEPIAQAALMHGLTGPAVGQQIRQARRQAIEAVWAK